VQALSLFVPAREYETMVESARGYTRAVVSVDEEVVNRDTSLLCRVRRVSLWRSRPHRGAPRPLSPETAQF
jgi:hypothetical protein